ncbi:hypothetical protein [Actinosynnema sp. NPDC020468]|uniref:hypothetical protein n=1 Tax=Actinosynnema sp. NPDC020468 TaxID=3154488 RepID=UPI0033F08E00
MNLRKTFVGAAAALGGTAMMLGLGGTAMASTDADANAHVTPNVDANLGKFLAVGDLAKVDTTNPNGKVDVLNNQNATVEALANNLEANPLNTLLTDSHPTAPAVLGLWGNA